MPIRRHAPSAGPSPILLIIAVAAVAAAAGVVTACGSGQILDGTTGAREQIDAGPDAMTNEPPTLNAGADQTITLPVDTATFTAIASDADGSVVSFAWTKVSGGAATLAGADSADLVVTGLAAGAYVFRVVALDDRGAGTSDEVSLTVLPQPANVLPTVSAGSDQSITLPAAMATFMASAADSDGTIVSLAWTKQSGGAATLAGATTDTLQVTGLAAGDYVFRVTATDDRGGTAFDEVALTVNPEEVEANNPPTVNAGADKTITLPTSTTTFTAMASDSDGTIASIQWTKRAGGAVTLAGATTSTLSLSNLEAGAYLFRVTVTDDDGATAFDEVALTVNAQPPNVLPTVSAGADKTITLPTSMAMFTAAAADSDGTIVSTLWTKQAGGAATLSGANTATLTVSGVVEGSYLFRVTVTDDRGGTASDDVMLTVNPANTTCNGGGASTALSFSVTPYASPDLVAPGRGAEQWHDRVSVNVPSEGTNTRPPDVYYRLHWSQLESTQGTYTWGPLDNLINEAIDRGQKFSFGIMTVCPGCSNNTINIGGAYSGYPAYVHNAMQAEAVKDWNAGGTWSPNWNSPTYLARYEALLVALNAHLYATSRSGVRYADAIGYIDIRGYGAYGEWHVAGIADTVNDQPAGVKATPATLKRIIDMHVSAFPDLPLVALICAFDGARYPNMGATAEVAYHALTVANNFGPIGWRRDNWGDEDNSYIRYLLDLNPATYNGQSLSTLIMDRWKTSPIVGEPPGYTATANTCEYDYLETQVRRYHAASFGNGNFVQTNQACMRDNIRAASKATGYRLQVESGAISPSLLAGGAFSVQLGWRNAGIAPTYERWNVVFELRGAGGAVAWSGTSTFQPFRFLPAAAVSNVTDTFNLPAGLTPGTYDLVMVVRDPSGFRAPLPLAIGGRRADGSYLLKSVTVEACP